MKILIVKLGYSETLDSEIGIVPSLGDVLRTTPILLALKKKYSDSKISWLVSKEAEPLLRGNTYLDRILVWDDFVPFQLMKEKFDMLINLEKIPGLCALVDMIDAWSKYGFRFDSNTGIYKAYEKGASIVKYIEEKNSSTIPGDEWQKNLIKMLDLPSIDQHYLLAYKPNSTVENDIGLNYMVGSKWQNKAMRYDKWEYLAEVLSDFSYKISWQQGKEDIFEYMDWIYSCKLIITGDSLGQHLAQAYNKKIICLVGPTNSSELVHNENTIFLKSPEICDKMPCNQPKCMTKQNCINQIEISDIVKSMKILLG